ncbi:MAG: (2Fe-2S)-binding protein [Planctomycetales bacterium]|nr:(2Fe-2S)-binding protein [Planctomycetales bacterium]
MELDDDLCLCFHVTKRKVVNYLRVERPRRVGELAHCFGAGTGCGWCRPFLQKLFDQAVAGGEIEADLPTSEDYARLRAGYIQAGKGTPPGGAGSA